MPDQLSQSDHDNIIRIHERLVSMDEKLNAEQRNQTKLHDNLEARVKSVEDWKQNMSGRFAVIATVAAFAGSIVATIVINLIQDKL